VGAADHDQHYAPSLEGVKPLDDEAVGSVNADRDEALVTDRGEAARGVWPYHDDVAGSGNDLFPIDNHRDLAGSNDAGLGIGMLMQSGSFAWLKVADEEGNAGTVWLTFELDSGDHAFPLIALVQDREHSTQNAPAKGRRLAAQRPRPSLV
jgi:hypothetical protein